MKYSNFYTKAKELRQQECEEVIKALNAHGGSYQWNSNNYPIIPINADKSCPFSQDIRIFRATVVNGNLELWGVDNKYGNPVEFNVSDVFAGYLSFIIDYIPETKEVSDVSGSQKDKPFIPKIGACVWIFNKDRRDKANDRYGEITRVGKKYFYVKAGMHNEVRFEIHTLVHDNGECSPRYELYSTQEICELHKDAEKKRYILSDSLFRHLSDEETIELYNNLIRRVKF